MDNNGENTEKEDFKYTKSDDWLMFPSFKRPNHTFSIHLKTGEVHWTLTETLIDQYVIPDNSLTQDVEPMEEDVDAPREKVWSYFTKYSVKLGPRSKEPQRPKPDDYRPIWWPYHCYVVLDFETLAKFDYVKYLNGIKKCRFIIFLPYVVQLEIVRCSENETLSKSITKFLKNQSEIEDKERILELQLVNNTIPFESKIDGIIRMCLRIRQEGGNVVLATENAPLVQKAKECRHIKVINHQVLISHMRVNSL